MILIGALHVGLDANEDVALAVLIEQQAVFGNAARDGRAQRAVGALAVGARAPDGVDVRRGTGFGERADLAEVRHIGGDVGGAVVAEYRAERTVGIVRADHVSNVFRIRGVGAGAGKVAGAEARVERRRHAAARAGLDQLLGKPEVAVLIAQGHMRPLDRHHALCVKALADADLDLHGIGCALAIFALQHGFLFIVENHVFPSCFLLDGHS